MKNHTFSKLSILVNKSSLSSGILFFLIYYSVFSFFSDCKATNKIIKILNIIQIQIYNGMIKQRKNPKRPRVNGIIQIWQTAAIVDVLFICLFTF